jgi:hypothetical protein
MSSFVAHALVGASCFALARPKTFRQSLPLLIIAGLLGFSPDVDYLFLWLADWRPNPRITHSLAFVTSAALLAWGVVKFFSTREANFGLLLIFLAAAFSHLVLDALVGVTQNPIAWPFITEGFSSPIGVLPSAGKPDILNYYFWRNLFIELGIIVPLLACAYSLTCPTRHFWLSWKVILGLGIFLTSLGFSLSLSR